MSDPDWVGDLKSRLSAAIDPKRTPAPVPKETPLLKPAPPERPKMELIPVTRPPVAQLQDTRHNTFTLTDEWWCDDWEKILAWVMVERMSYGQFMAFMTAANAAFAEIEALHPDWKAEQISPEAFQAWGNKKLSK